MFESISPLSNPVLQFFLLSVIILFAPIVLRKLKIPSLMGLIIAGAAIGPHGFYLMRRDSSVILLGTAGLLYIMFLAGLEINIGEFKKNSHKSLVFGLYTFIIPMVIGTLTGLYILKFSIETSVLLASMFASHTLIAYPIISKLGVTKNTAVHVAIGGTMVTDTLALLVLAVIVRMCAGVINMEFWIRMSLSALIFALIVVLLFPVFGRWFFKRFDDNVSQYIFVLAMIFLGGLLAQMAGLEPIIGAFLAGLSLNRLIPSISPLMNRIEFVGNAIFIPFFLIGVGMLVDYKAFFKDFETIKVAAVMIIVATSSKFIAAWLAQKTYNFSVDERRLIFGLSNAQAAATLAVVLVGYNIVIGKTETGEPIRLLSEAVLDGTILMILVTCTIASFAAQKGARNLALAESNETSTDEGEVQEKILIPVSNIENTEELVNFGIRIKSKQNKKGLLALSVVDNTSTNGSAAIKAKKLLNKAASAASATDNTLHELLRYDINVVNGIISVIKEHRVTDLVLGLHVKQGITDSFLGILIEGILKKCNITILIYKPFQPFCTIKRFIVIVPENAEKEIGFPFWLIKVWNIAQNSGARIIFYATKETLKFIKELHSKHPVEAEFVEFNQWSDFLRLSSSFQRNDKLIIVMSRKNQYSYHRGMKKIPFYLNRFFKDKSFILIYPKQTGVSDTATIDFKNPAIIDSLEKLDEIGKTMAKIFKRK